MLRHLPNLLTLLRIALVPLLALRVMQHDYEAALTIALVAAITDALDGLLARRFRWQSRLGGILDPLADKLLLTVSFVVLALVGAIPVWLTWLVLSRDLVIVLGAIAYHFIVGRFDAQPTRLSKLTTLVQILLVLEALLRLSSLWIAPPWVETSLIAATALLSIASGLHYVVHWGGKARREHPQRTPP